MRERGNVLGWRCGDRVGCFGSWSFPFILILVEVLVLGLRSMDGLLDGDKSFLMFDLLLARRGVATISKGVRVG